MESVPHHDLSPSLLVHDCPERTAFLLWMNKRRPMNIYNIMIAQQHLGYTVGLLPHGKEKRAVQKVNGLHAYSLISRRRRRSAVRCSVGDVKSSWHERLGVVVKRLAFLRR
eukprot:scaffold9463_cov140-Skeletonema_menzelii.AAC.6